MDSNFRIIDANLNRASEGLRVLEEVARFKMNDQGLSKEFKNVRHKINSFFSLEYFKLLESRNSIDDVGLKIENCSNRITLTDVIKANFKRVEQALRVLEEYSKIEYCNIDNSFENERYKIYDLEKKMSSEIIKYYKRQKLCNARLYLVTERKWFKSNDHFIDTIASAIKGGVDIIQLREKEASAKEIIELAKTIRQLCYETDVIFIINDRVDIAQCVKADGVHLGQDDISIEYARNILGSETIIGVSTHCPEDAKNAVSKGADYIGVGPVYTTPTKPGRSAVGLEYVKWSQKNVDIPFFAIGGIDLSNVNEVLSIGISGIAVVRAIMQSDNPYITAQQFKNILNEQGGLNANYA